MGRSLSLAAYRALSRRRLSQPVPDAKPPRPKGPLFWAHAGDTMRLAALADLARRLKVMRPGLSILITHDPGTRPARGTAADDGADWVQELGPDHPSAARHFVEHWAPDVCLWTGGQLWVNLVSTASERGVAMILADISGADFQSGRHKWFPALTRSTLDVFDTILTNSQDAARGVWRLGVAPEKVDITQRMRVGAMPPDCSEDDLDMVMQDLSSRPVWLAAAVRRDEIDSVLTAHRAALRLAHRLLLVVTLADPADETVLKDSLRQLRLRFADWDNGDPVEDSVQIVISASDEDIGLWYRTAPLAFLASSLSPGATGINPLAAAALGSAILYGPNVSDHIESYSRLAAAGAARAVSDGESLGAALVQLIAPDQAAAMALAGWEVATEGADLIDRLIDLVMDGLDRREATHARP